MPSIDAAFALGDGPYFVYITIEALGDLYDGDEPRMWKLCSRRPPWSVVGDEYKDYLSDWPSSIPETANIFGGRVSAGELSVALTDGYDPDDRYAVTAKLRDDALAVAYLVNAISATATEIVLSAGDVVFAPQLIYCDGEAMLVSGGGEGTYSISRGELGTTARSHRAGARIYDVMPYYRSRRIRLYYGTIDGTVADEEEIGQSWFLDTCEMPRGMLTYLLRGKSQDKFLDRKICSVYDQKKSGNGGAIRIASPLLVSGLLLMRGNLAAKIEGDVQSVSSLIAFNNTYPIWAEGFRFVLVDDEVIGGVSTPNGMQAPIWRGLGGTKIKDHDIGAPFVEILCADADVKKDASTQVGSFRYQPLPVDLVSRYFDPNVITDHPIPIVLNVMLSSANDDDGLELTNYQIGDAYNFSLLPPGFGIGMPRELVNVQSFIDVWERHPEWRSPNTIFGPHKIEAVRTGSFSGFSVTTLSDLSFAQWFEREFGWTGMILQIVDGQWTCTLSRIPLVGELAAETITEADVLTDRQADGSYRPRISARKSMDYLVSRVTFRHKNNTGDEVSITYTDDDFKEVLGQSGLFYAEDRTIDIPAPGFRGDGTDPLLRRAGLIRLLRYFRPVWEVELESHPRIRTINPGQIVGLTNRMIPKNGLRGWTGEAVIGFYKNPIMQPGKVGIAWKFIAYALPGNFGRVSPALRIITIASAGGSNLDITCSANVFSEPEVDASYLNSSLAGVGSLLQVRDRSLALQSTSSAAIVSFPSANVVRINGDMGGFLETGVGLAGYLLTFATRGVPPTSNQRTYWTYLGGLNGTILDLQENWSYSDS